MNTMTAPGESGPRPVTGIERHAIDLQVGMKAMSLAARALSRDGARLPSRRELTLWGRKLLSLGSFQRMLRDKKYVRFAGHVYFDAFAPRYPGPAFDQTIAATVRRADGRTAAGRRYIPLAVIAITDRCMYRCEHCYARDVLRRQDSLSLDQWRKVVDHLQEEGVGVIAFEGGEPLMRFDDLAALCEHARERSELWVATTGFGLTKEKARRLAAAGLSGAAISLDHYEPEKHNAFRGHRKAFASATQAVSLFAEAGILPALSVCATREVLTDNGLDRYLRLAQELGAGFVQILDPVPSGSYLGRGDEVCLTVKELRSLQRYQHEANTLPRYRDCPGVSTRVMLEDDHSFGCGAGGNGILYINPAGNLQPCPFLGVSTGNVVTEGFDAPMARMRKLFPRAAAVGVTCPAQTMGDQIATAREESGALPLPYEQTRRLCSHFADLPQPRLMVSES